MNSVERFIREKTKRFKKTKALIYLVYQSCFWLLSDRVPVTGDVRRVSPNDNHEYYFGYYDVSPWDLTDRYMLCLRVKNSYKAAALKEPAEIILIDTSNDNSFKVIAETRAWNTQMGCRAQWVGPDFSKRIIFNDFREGKFCSVILDLESGAERVLCMPVYDVSKCSKFALSLDFARLQRLRQGYGYTNLPDSDTSNIPDKPCIYRLDIEKNEAKAILSYNDLFKFETRSDMVNAEHKVNHIMINPCGERFMVLHRWFNNGVKFTRLVTADCDGGNLYNLLDDNMTSHSFWKNDSEILTFAAKKPHGSGYYLLKDKSSEYSQTLPTLKVDGHPSYSPDGSRIITDTYPNRERKSRLYLNVVGEEGCETIATVFNPFKYKGIVRCDLHPRWNRSGDKICFDGTFEGRRRLYTVDVADNLATII